MIVEIRDVNTNFFRKSFEKFLRILESTIRKNQRKKVCHFSISPTKLVNGESEKILETVNTHRIQSSGIQKIFCVLSADFSVLSQEENRYLSARNTRKIQATKQMKKTDFVNSKFPLTQILKGIQIV